MARKKSTPSKEPRSSGTAGKKSANPGRKPKMDRAALAESTSPRSVRGQFRRPDGRPAAGVLVRAYDHDLRGENFLGEIHTDEQGNYEIAYSEEQFRRSGQERGGADLIVRGLDAAGAVIASSRELKDAPPQAVVDILVREQAALASDAPLIVRGQIRLADGTPFAGVLVHVYDKDLRSEELLGEMNADRDGRFEIGYSAAQFTSAEKGAADLLVKAMRPDGTVLAAGEILFNAPPLAEVDVVVPADAWQPPTLFEKIRAALPPLLQDLKVEQLEENEEHRDLSFLSGETGFERRDLARYALAHLLAKPGLEPEAWFAVLGSSIFVFAEDQTLAQRLASVLGSLSSLDEATLRKSFGRAFNQSEIPAPLRKKVPGWIEAFLGFAAEQVLNGEKEPAFVKLALENAGIEDAERQLKFAELLNLRKRFAPELLAALKEDGSFKEDEIADLHTSFRLAELTRGDFSVVRMLKQQFELRRPEDIRLLAKRSQSEWVDLVTKWHAAGEINLPIHVGEIPDQATFPQADFYAKVLERQFREAFPTAAFAGGLERALQNGGTHGLSHAESLKEFLAYHANFEFLKTSVDEFLTSELHPELKALAEDDGFKLELKAIQRVFKLVPTFEAADTLLAEGIHSAQQIYRMGETQFVRRHSDSPGFSAESASLAWNRAADTHAAVLTIVGDLKSLEDGAMPLALRMATQALASFPNWDNLFKTGDLCDCDPCRSVLSPAAYLADLLVFLRDRGAGNTTVKDVLFGRRADLGYLELNCENAHTPMPYIDAVCEVLEEAIAPDEKDIELTGLTSLPADPVLAKRRVLIAFTRAQINLGADFSLSQVNPSDPDRWVVHGDEATYLLKKKTTANFFAQILFNTKASADELRAYPQYVNPKAYLKLRAARYPLALPFDLFAEEVRATFRKINLWRWDLMRTLRGPAAPNNPLDSDIAAEYFGISTDPAAAFDEKRLILEADPTAAGQQELWGELGNIRWLRTVANVKNFLRKTGLEYNELLALLDLKFINPTGDMHIDFGGNPGCDTDKQYIEPLDADKLDRIHRFLRLWRKLPGWRLWELDLVLHQPSIGKDLLEEPFLTNLFYFSELKNKLGAGTTVEQTAALFEDLNVETHFTRAHEKRGQALYQNLFLNRKLARPLDPAFAVERVNVPAPTAENIPAHHPVLLAVLGIREADLLLLEGLTRASNGAAYISNDLTLENLSFLWRHTWLSKRLKLKVQDWKALLRIARRDVLKFEDPKTALEFLEMLDQIKATGFTPDDLAWLLAADRSTSAALKETAAGSFLLGLRRQLQAIRDEYAPAQYDFLSATPPTDEERLAALLIALFSKLNRSENDAQLFLATLRGRVLLQAEARGLPASFAFPTTVTGAPDYIPIRYDAANATVHFTGLMTNAQQTSLLNIASPAIAALAAAAVLDADAPGLPTDFVFPTAITGAPNSISIQYDDGPNALIRFTGLMTEAQRATLLNDASLAAVTANSGYQAAIEDLFQKSLAILNSYQNAIRELYQQSLAAPTQYVLTRVKVTPAPTLPADGPSIPLRYDPLTQTLTFIGVMTSAEKTALEAIASNPQEAIAELYARPRLAVKFFDPAFTAPLEVLPQGVDFQAQLPSDLAAKIAYDAELRVLRFNGVPSAEERKTLNALAIGNLPAEVAYRAAVASLAAQAESVTPPDERIWLTSADLDDTQSSMDTLAKRLAVAARKALRYLSDSFMANAVVAQCSSQLGITQSLTRRLVTQYEVLPGSLLSHLTGAFTATTSAVAYAEHKTTFDAWFWANRVAAIWKKWKISSEDLDELSGLMAGAQLLDFASLPLDSSGPIASLEKFLRTARLLRIREGLPEDTVTFFEVLDKLNAGGYSSAVQVQGWPVGFSFPAAILTALGRNSIRYDGASTTLRFTGLMSAQQRQLLLNDPSLSVVTGIAAYRQAIEELFTSLVQDFAVDVQGINRNWPAAETQGLVAALDIDDYLLPESWERLRRAYTFLDNLSGGAEAIKSFAAPSMGESEVKSLKELLRSRLGVETWLPLCAEIQDDLRERKRDALAAYLLTQPKPVDAPSDKWENTNDLYAYYLLDVEMGACQLTTRIVQALGSVQLFVQRCLMGLEPAVSIDAKADSAWRWWEWMRKYRVWEANRKVFLWPENWIEPELKRDRSQFFKDMENELLQNEVNQENVQAALLSYLEKLVGVAQLEIAALYQEDNGDDSIVHVFARTSGAEPHQYYYRRYNYRQWTPWEKVELDIQGDYLIPAVVNRQLFLFWPVFTEMPDEAGNSTVSIPALGQTSFTPDKTEKRLRLQMALSQYRQGQWAPKKVSKSYDESGSYSGEIVNKYHQFVPIDRSDLDGRFSIMYQGHIRDGTGHWRARLKGEIEFSGCNGVGELIFHPGTASRAYLTTRPEALSAGDEMISLKWVELDTRGDWPDDDLTLETNDGVGPSKSIEVLAQTPGTYRIAPAWQYSYMDKLSERVGVRYPSSPVLAGTWLPFFYGGKDRTFFVLPASNQGAPLHYPDIRSNLRAVENFYNAQVNGWVDIFIANLSPVQREDVIRWLWGMYQFPWQASYTDAELKSLVERYPQEAVYEYLRTLAADLLQFQQFHFKNFYHPFLCDFANLAYDSLEGIPALISRETQMKDSGFSFTGIFDPTAAVVDPATDAYYPQEIVDFSRDGAYASYNWELFFHAPLLIANALSRNQRFEEARNWYHFIFNPMGVGNTMPGGSPMSKYWITRPFFETTDPQYVQQRIDNILRILAGDISIPGAVDAAAAITESVFDWRTYPFEPHRIAGYRMVAYQKTVIMKYLDNLITWGDYLFRQDSMESINEATQLYVLAAEILGPRPKVVPPPARPSVESFNELEYQFDLFSNALVLVENVVPVLSGSKPGRSNQPPLPMLYFCIPQNEKLLGYWDTVADRLYKIRHCMNIEGAARQLALFEPPIDPGALVKAVAGGADISSALADMNAPLPFYRFNVLLQKANEICGDVKMLGGGLLAALEKKDAESLALLRQGQEIRVLEAVKAVRQGQIEEALENLEALRKNKELIIVRRDYYQNIQKISAGETLHQDKLQEAFIAQQVSQIISVAASIAHSVPSFDVGGAGAGGSPRAGVSFGGPNIGNSLQAVAGGATFLANMENFLANKASINAGYERRWEDWKQQEKLANKELEQIDKSISAAEQRILIAQKELANHELQIENARATDEFMRSKYTGEELHQWQIGQISAVYFQSYRLAYDLAKRAERCFRFELGLQNSSYINFGHWDSLKKGLLSGEKLQYDLRRLETAYLEHNRREYELTKHISLALLDPLALIKLRETGRCFLRLPEEIFDLDYPGHYFRRIKSVSLTLPSVVGAYTTVSCTLRLLKNSIRINTANGRDGYPRDVDEQGLPAADERFIENSIPVKAIAASSAQNDSGMFELSFRDERYLPFEGAGVVSEWALELFNDAEYKDRSTGQPDFGKPLRQFDYSTIPDVILHIKYTAREDAGRFKSDAVVHLRSYFGQADATPVLRMFNLRQEFPTQWSRFLNPVNAANGNVFELEMSPSFFSRRDSEKTLRVNTIWLLARCADPGGYTVMMVPPLALPPPAPATDPNKLTLVPSNRYGNLHFAQLDVDVDMDPMAAPVKWQIKMSRPGGGNLQKDPLKEGMEVEDLMLVLGYQWE